MPELTVSIVRLVTISFFIKRCIRGCLQTTINQPNFSKGLTYTSSLVYDLVTGFQYLDFNELEFGGDESDSWRWMFDDYYGYLTNQKTWGVLTQEGGTVVLVPQLSYNEPDPSQQWTLDYNGQTQSA